VRRVVVTGAGGLLGVAVVRHFRSRLDAVEGWTQTTRALPDGTSLRPLDLTAPDAPEAALATLRPDLVVHCAALTDVDGCERDPAAARTLNALVPGRLAATAAAVGARFVHISTDAVYDGERPGAHHEDDAPGPCNVYAETKLEGERRVLDADPEALVLRTNMHGWTERGRLSFSEVILRGLAQGDPLTLFTDVSFSPLVVSDHARLIAALVERGTSGVLNFGAADAVSKAAFGHLVADVFGLPADGIEGVTLASRNLTAARPRNTALDTGRLAAALGTAPPTVADGVRRLRETLATARPELRDLVHDPGRL
jgi:dTDP-4-dehydrorhamnose reductase